MIKFDLQRSEPDLPLVEDPASIFARLVLADFAFKKGQPPIVPDPTARAAGVVAGDLDFYELGKAAFGIHQAAAVSDTQSATLLGKHVRYSVSSDQPVFQDQSLRC